MMGPSPCSVLTSLDDLGYITPAFWASASLSYQMRGLDRMSSPKHEGFPKGLQGFLNIDVSSTKHQSFQQHKDPVCWLDLSPGLCGRETFDVNVLGKALGQMVAKHLPSSSNHRGLCFCCCFSSAGRHIISASIFSSS